MKSILFTCAIIFFILISQRSLAQNSDTLGAEKAIYNNTEVFQKMIKPQLPVTKKVLKSEPSNGLPETVIRVKVSLPGERIVAIPLIIDESETAIKKK